jgi:hypothetical protein
MNAYAGDKKTLAHQLGEKASELTDHFLLMTAAPGASWAERDRAARLVFARDGRSLAATVGNGRLAERALLDLNANVPTEVEALESDRQR